MWTRGLLGETLRHREAILQHLIPLASAPQTPQEDDERHHRTQERACDPGDHGGIHGATRSDTISRRAGRWRQCLAVRVGFLWIPVFLLVGGFRRSGPPKCCKNRAMLQCHQAKKSTCPNVPTKNFAPQDVSTRLALLVVAVCACSLQLGAFMSLILSVHLS